MSTLRVNNVKDLAGIAGFTLSTGGITANATLIVGDITTVSYTHLTLPTSDLV